MKWREDLEDFVMTKTKERRPISVESAGRVVGVIAATGVRLGGGAQASRPALGRPAGGLG